MKTANKNIVSVDYVQGLVRNKQYHEAIQLYKRMIVKNKTEAVLCHNLAGVYVLVEDYDNAKKFYKKAIEISNGNKGDSYHGLGLCYQLLKEYADAVKYYQIAYDKGFNDHYPMLYNWAKALAVMGKFEESEELYYKAHELSGDVDFFSNVASLRKFKSLDHKSFHLLKKASNNPNLTEIQKIGTYYGLGKIYDDCGYYDEAFECFELANRTYPKNKPVRSFLSAEYVETMRTTFLESDNKFNVCTHPGKFSPIFIVGCPRSGTTIIEQLLSENSKVCAAGELNYLDIILSNHKVLKSKEMIPYPQSIPHLKEAHYLEISKKYCGLLEKHNPQRKPYVTDKMPGNYLYLGIISLVFPNAKIIHCRRHPLDVCLSMYMQYFSDNPAYYSDLKEMAIYYKNYVKLMDVWRECPQVEFKEVMYEKFVTNQKVEEKSILDYCGLLNHEQTHADLSGERAILTASCWQAKQPIYNSSINRWKNYEKHLGELKDLLHDEIKDYENLIASI